jgi:hypothetical protein
MDKEKKSAMTRKALTGITLQLPALDPYEFHSIELYSDEMPVVKQPNQYSDEKYEPISLAFDSVEMIPLEITSTQTEIKTTPKEVFQVTKSYKALPIFEIKKEFF